MTTAAYDTCTDLISEIDAFYEGFGQPDALTAAMRAAALIVPLTADRRIWTSKTHDIHWIPAFTSDDELARFIVARGGTDASGEVLFHTLFGWRLVDEIAPSMDGFVGIAINMKGEGPLAFPPSIDESVQRQGQ